MNLHRRIEVLSELGRYMMSDEASWKIVRDRASAENSWFTPEFVELAVNNIAKQFLERSRLELWCRQYDIPEHLADLKTVGVVMAGNIPLVGMHDFLSVFISGNRQLIKLSSKDKTLLGHLADYLGRLEPECNNLISFSERLNGCDAYIATGNNNSARYFHYYFAKYPHVIRRNRTSVAILQGNEKKDELAKLALDICQYFGLGCRNVTKLMVPGDYDFMPLLESLRKFDYFIDHPRYKNNYDYQLALLILNNKFYMSNGSTILVENRSLFSAISVLHYQTYSSEEAASIETENHEDIQCVVGKNHVEFGETQQPGLSDYADRIDTMKFLMGIN